MVDEERVLERRVVVPTAVTPPVTELTEVHVRRSPSGVEMLRRLTVLIFGIIQAFILLRIVLLLVDAGRGNAIVTFIYDVSQVFVAPFEGILGSDAIGGGGSLLDLAAVVALVGWTILELIVLAVVGILRREP